ncbi:MAG: flagellar filament capping protein FliD [Polyangiaceae bacterium]
MSTISFGGLSSGLDTNAIIDAMVGAEKVPLTAIQTKQQTLTSAISTVNAIASKLGNLKNAAQALSTTNGFSSFKASSSDSSAVVATVTGGASAGAFDLSVQSLAKEQRTYSSNFSSSTSALGQTGTLSIAVGSGTAVDVNVAATDSLTDVATKINSAGLRATATVVYDGTNYKLQVRGQDTGAANAITFNETGSSIGLTNTVQSASDARLTLDGMTITRSTNQIVGVIPGVTLALQKTTSSPVSVHVDTDADGLTSKINALVTAYNDVVAYSQSASGYGQTKATNAMLAGDSTIRSVLSKLGLSIGTPVPGTTGRYTTLGSVGLSTNRDGRLSFDQTKLATALSADSVGVQKLFVASTELGSTGAMTGLMNTVNQLANQPNSLLKLKADSMGVQSNRLEDDAAAQQRRIDGLEVQLRQRFSDLEAVVSKYKAQGNSLTSALSSLSTTG